MDTGSIKRLRENIIGSHERSEQGKRIISAVV